MIWLFSILLAMQLDVAPEPTGIAPSSVSGLIAHYDADALHQRLRDGEPVERWEDLSGNGHDLTSSFDNQPPAYRVKKLGGMPIVEIRKGNQLMVEQPFDLEDHTIFLIHSARHNQSALFTSEQDDRRGLRLSLGGRTHSYQAGKRGDAHYNAPRPLSHAYAVTVLGREAGIMKAFINGVEYSSNTQMDEPMRVGRLFHLRQSKYVTSGGEGLKIAELIFYDRFLGKSERGGLTDYLAAKYGIKVEQSVLPRKILEPGMEFEVDPASALANMSSRSEIELNDELVAIPWKSETPVAAPFTFDGEYAAAELHCAKDATRVRITVNVPLSSAEAGVELRGLLLLNAKEYHPEETRSGPFDSAEVGYSAALSLSTTMTLEAGDFIEFIVSRAAGEGSVRIAPSGARLLIEPID